MTEIERHRAIRDYVDRDRFAGRLGAKIEVLEPGFARVSLTISDDMTNFHGSAHGGVVFSLADFALAAASNSRGQTAYALSIDIAFLRAAAVGAELVAEAREVSANGPTALYELTVRLRDGDVPVARAQAIAYRKKQWFVAE